MGGSVATGKSLDSSFHPSVQRVNSKFCVTQIAIATNNINGQHNLEGVYFKYSDGTMKFFGGSREDHTYTSILLTLIEGEYIKSMVYKAKEGILQAIRFITSTKRSSFCPKLDSHFGSDTKGSSTVTHIAQSSGGIAGIQCSINISGIPSNISNVFEYADVNDSEKNCLQEMEWNLVGDDPLQPSRDSRIDDTQLPVIFLPSDSSVTRVQVQHRFDMRINGVKLTYSDGSSKYFGTIDKSANICPPSFVLADGEYINIIRYKQHRTLHRNELYSIQFFTNRGKMSPFYNYVPTSDPIYQQVLRHSKGFAGFKMTPDSAAIDLFLEFDEFGGKYLDDIASYESISSTSTHNLVDEADSHSDDDYDNAASQLRDVEPSTSR